MEINKTSSNLTTSLNPNFQITMERLYGLKIIDPDLNEEEEDEILIPSDSAYNEAITLLNNLYKFLGESFPRGFCSVESRGGVNLIWRNQKFDRKMRIIIFSNHDVNKSLYYFSGDKSILIEEPTLSDIISQFLMFNEEN